MSSDFILDRDKYSVWEGSVLVDQGTLSAHGFTLEDFALHPSLIISELERRREGLEPLSRKETDKWRRYKVQHIDGFYITTFDGHELDRVKAREGLSEEERRNDMEFTLWLYLNQDKFD